jgi:hypothetical protein
MRRTSGADRWLLSPVALVPLALACQSTPVGDVAISPTSSLLAVDVVFPVPLGRDPSLVQVFLVKGPIRRGRKDPLELIPATFVKESRAYLLDPEPGTYSLVAVSSAVAAPLRERPVAGGVTATTLSGTLANATIFPTQLILRTRTTIGRGGVAFMGALRIVDGERINANAMFRDELQKRIAEHIRPGVSSETGLSSWFTMAWMPDLEQTSLSNDASDREAFLEAALLDLGVSPWAQVISRAQPREPAMVGARTPASATKSAASLPEAEAAKPQPRGTEPQPSGAKPKPAAAKPQAARAKLQPPQPSPERQRVPGIPPDSPLARIELGMSFDDVRKILGDPDDRIDRTTAKAWIPFYMGPDAYLRDWIYDGRGRVVFSLHRGSLHVIDVVYDPGQE